MDTTQINYNQATLALEQLDEQRAAHMHTQAQLLKGRIDLESAEFVLAEAQAKWEREHGYQSALANRRTAAIALITASVAAVSEHGLGAVDDVIAAIGASLRSNVSLFDLADSLSLEVAK